MKFRLEGFVWEKEPIVSVPYENEKISIKKQLTLLKKCYVSPRGGLWSFYGFLRADHLTLEGGGGGF